jgi:hypothetical protein
MFASLSRWMVALLGTGVMMFGLAAPAKAQAWKRPDGGYRYVPPTPGNAQILPSNPSAHPPLNPGNRWSGLIPPVDPWNGVRPYPPVYPPYYPPVYPPYYPPVRPGYNPYAPLLW